MKFIAADCGGSGVTVTVFRPSTSAAAVNLTDSECFEDTYVPTPANFTSSSTTEYIALLSSFLEPVYKEGDQLWLGLAGYNEPSESFQKALELVYPGIKITHDSALLLRSPNGGCLISGTGSSFTRSNPTTVYGGYGHILGDEGSAFAIGRLFLRHYLTGQSVSQTDIKVAESVFGSTDIFSSVYGPKGFLKVASIAEVLARFDPHHKAVLEAAKDLAQLVQANSSGMDSLSLGGSVLVNNQPFRETLLQCCGWQGPVHVIQSATRNACLNMYRGSRHRNAG